MTATTTSIPRRDRTSAQPKGSASIVRQVLRRGSIPGHAALLVIAVLTYIPVYFMLNNALRTGPALQSAPFAPVTDPHWRNFVFAWQASSYAYPRTLLIVVISTVGIALTTSMAGYAFARLRFREKEILFFAVFGLLLIPGFITLIPLYVQIGDFGLLGSQWGLILPYLAGGQALGTVVLRSAVESIPEELFEAAKLDGASHAWMYTSVALPLSAPLIIALALLNVVGLWGDYVLPSLVLQGDAATVSVAITGFTPPAFSPNLDSYNIQLAAFTLASVPIAVLVFLLMRYFVSGLSQSAIKL